MWTLLPCLCRIYSPVQDKGLAIPVLRHSSRGNHHADQRNHETSQCPIYLYTNAILALEPRQTPTITRSRSHFHRPQNLCLPSPPAPHTYTRNIGLVCILRMHMHEYTYLTFLEDGVRDFSAELCPKPAFQTRVKRTTFRSRQVSTQP